MTQIALVTGSVTAENVPASTIPTPNRGLLFKGSTVYVADDAEFALQTQQSWPLGNLASLTVPASHTIPADWLGTTANRMPGVTKVDPPYGVSTVRSHDYQVNGKSMRWHHIETSAGVFDWSRSDAWVNYWSTKGKDLIFLLGFTPSFYAGTAPAYATGKEAYGTGTSTAPTDMQKWVNFVSAVATRYAGKVKYYEVWNEPHFATGNSIYFYSDTAAKLAEMLRLANLVVKSIDASAKIISPAISALGTAERTELTSLLDASAVGLSFGGNIGTGTTGADWLDILGVHSYVSDVMYGKSIFADMAAIRTIRDARTCTGKPIWSTEVGILNAHQTTVWSRPARNARLLLATAAAGCSRVIHYAYDNDYMGVSGGALEDPDSAAAMESVRVACAGKTVSWANARASGEILVRFTDGSTVIR